MPHSHHSQALRLVILGRDGVLNRYRDDHVKDPQEWEALPGALQAVAKLNHAGWHTVVATNQAGIGRGLLDMGSLNLVHQAMHRQMTAAGARIDAVFFCPHAPEESCDCRKPQPGMMQQIADRYGVSVGGIPMVCDNLRDLQAAQAAGCRPHLVCTGRAAELSPEQQAEWLRLVPDTAVHLDLAAFAEALLAAPLPTPPAGKSAARAQRPAA